MHEQSSATLRQSHWSLSTDARMLCSAETATLYVSMNVQRSADEPEGDHKMKPHLLGSYAIRRNVCICVCTEECRITYGQIKAYAPWANSTEGPPIIHRSYSIPLLCCVNGELCVIDEEKSCMRVYLACALVTTHVLLPAMLPDQSTCKHLVKLKIVQNLEKACLLMDKRSSSRLRVWLSQHTECKDCLIKVWNLTFEPKSLPCSRKGSCPRIEKTYPAVITGLLQSVYSIRLHPYQ